MRTKRIEEVIMRVANAKTAGIVPTVFYEYLSIFSVLTLGLFARQSAA